MKTILMYSLLSAGVYLVPMSLQTTTDSKTQFTCETACKEECPPDCCEEFIERSSTPVKTTFVNAKVENTCNPKTSACCEKTALASNE